MSGMINVSMRPDWGKVAARFQVAGDNLKRNVRDGMREQMRRLVDLAQDEAPKKTGSFADAIHFRTYERGDAVEGNIYTPQPLGNYIALGTKPHLIAAKNAKTLAFYWEKGPKGAGMYFYPEVHHPGTKANKFLGRAYRRWHPGARTWLKDTALSYTRTIAGSK